MKKGAPVPTLSLADALPDRVTLLALDFDGVMTDNAVYVGQDGQEWVRCSRGDGMGIALLRRAGVPVWVLSTETNPVVQARCTKLRIGCIQGCEDKTAVLQRFLKEQGWEPQEVVFVGNDVNDVGCLKLVGCGVAVADAHPVAQAVADVVLAERGGHGAVRVVCDAILAKLALKQVA